MTTKTKKRPRKVWKNVLLKEHNGGNGGLFGTSKSTLYEQQELSSQETQKKLQDALKSGFLAAMEDVHDDPSLDIHDFVEACEHAIAELKATAANMARKPDPGKPVVLPTDEPETVAVSSDDFPSKGKAFAESFLQPEPKPRHLSLVEYKHRQKLAFKQLS